MLTDAQIRNAKPPTGKPDKLRDGNGLYLVVNPSGTKLWRYRYKIGGVENVFAIGEYPTVSLSDARAMRDEARGLVKKGIHPAHHRQAERLVTQAESADTFEAVAREWIAKKKPTWTPYYLRQVESFMAADVFPHIGRMPIRSVTAAHLLAVIRRIEEREALTVAVLVRQWASAVFRYAVATLRADGDPAAALKGAIQRKKVEHHKPLTRDQIGEFTRALGEFGGYRTTVIALRLMLLTAVRTAELRGARWAEFDLDAAEWRVPAERMKMRDAHTVPLSRQAVELLRELHTLTGGQSFLFPNYRSPNTCMTATTLNRALERMGFNGRDSIGFSAHGFRATFSTIANELGYRSDVVERQLAHVERNQVRAAYNQAAYMPERVELMQQWADLCDALERGDKVIPFRRAAA